MIHLDIYTKELKKLIGQLNDSNLDAHLNDPKSKKLQHSSSDNKPFFNPDDDPKKIAELNTVPLSDERKEKLQIQLLHESQTYYMNNINIFSNGLSLLAVNCLEVHSMVHQASTQTEEMESVAKNAAVHTKLMVDKTEEMIQTL